MNSIYQEFALSGVRIIKGLLYLFVEDQKVFFIGYYFQVKERPDVGVYVKDLSAYVVNNADDMDRTMSTGNRNRK